MLVLPICVSVGMFCVERFLIITRFVIVALMVITHFRNRLFFVAMSSGNMNRSQPCGAKHEGQNHSDSDENGFTHK